jgi:hypothetical protein
MIIARPVIDECPHKQICDKLNNGKFEVCFNPPYALDCGCQKYQKERKKR